MKLNIILIFLFACAAPVQKPVVIAPAPPAPEPVVEKAPAEEMAIEGTLGQLSEHDIAEVFKARWPEVTACYEKAQNALPYLSGQVEVKVKVSGAGKPASVFVSQSDFGNYELEHCVLAVVEDLDFPAPHGGKDAEFRYPLQFRAQQNLVAWERSKVFDSTRGRKMKADLKNCASAGALQPVRVTVYVAPGGKVTSAGLATDAPVDERYSQCVVQTAQRFRLEDPKDGIAKVTLDPSEATGSLMNLSKGK